MKNNPILGFLAIVIASLTISMGLAQSNLSSVSTGISIAQPTQQTQTTVSFSDAVMHAAPSQTSQMVSTYFTPLLSNSGITIPTGAVTSTITIQFYSNGASSMDVSFVSDPSKLPGVPPGF